MLTGTEMTVTTSMDAAITKWEAGLQSKAAEVAAKYSTPQTAAVMVADLNHWRDIAAEFARVGRTMSNVNSAMIGEIERIHNDLVYLSGYVGQLPPSQQVTRQTLIDRAVTSMTAPIAWLLQVGTPALKADARYGDLVKKATDAPSLTLGWLFDQIRKALKLPSWAVPVAATVVAAGVGYWAYATFLKPVGRVARLANPRRRRRRRIVRKRKR